MLAQDTGKNQHLDLSTSTCMLDGPQRGLPTATNPRWSACTRPSQRSRKTQLIAYQNSKSILSVLRNKRRRLGTANMPAYQSPLHKYLESRSSSDEPDQCWEITFFSKRKCYAKFCWFLHVLHVFADMRLIKLIEGSTFDRCFRIMISILPPKLCQGFAYMQLSIGHSQVLQELYKDSHANKCTRSPQHQTRMQRAGVNPQCWH